MPPKKKRAIPRPVHFETTIPVIRPCRRCGVWVAAGIVEGLKSVAEIAVLEPYQIPIAIMARLDLFVLRRSGLIQMTQSRLEGRFLGRIYPEHRCEIRWHKEPVPKTYTVSRIDGQPPF